MYVLGEGAGMNFDPGLIKFIDTKVKCCHLKILTCKGTCFCGAVRNDFEGCNIIMRGIGRGGP